MNLGGFSLTGPREANEDSYFFRDFTVDDSRLRGISAFVMVSDGMGGYQGGDVASSLAVQAAQTYLDQLVELGKGQPIDIDPLAALAEIVQRAHDAIMLVARERGGASMGATFVGAFLSPTHAWIGHVGDSRAYLIREGEAFQLTEDHSQVGRMLSQGILTEEEAQNHPNRNRIERALGFPNYEIEFDEVDLEAQDAMLLCSDGVYTAVNGAELVAFLDEAANAAEAAQLVTNGAISGGTDDNSTVVIAKGFINTQERAIPGHPSVLPTMGGIKPAPARRPIARTLTDLDGVKPVRDDDLPPYSSDYPRRRLADQDTQRRRVASRTNGASSYRSTRQRDTAPIPRDRLSRARGYQSRAGVRSSYAKRSALSASGARYSRRGAQELASRFTLRTMIYGIIAVLVIILVIIFAVNSCSNTNSVEDSSGTAAQTAQTSQSDQPDQSDQADSSDAENGNTDREAPSTSSSDGTGSSDDEDETNDVSDESSPEGEDVDGV